MYLDTEKGIQCFHVWFGIFLTVCTFCFIIKSLNAWFSWHNWYSAIFKRSFLIRTEYWFPFAEILFTNAECCLWKSLINHLRKILIITADDMLTVSWHYNELQGYCCRNSNFRSRIERIKKTRNRDDSRCTKTD